MSASAFKVVSIFAHVLQRRKTRWISCKRGLLLAYSRHMRACNARGWYERRPWHQAHARAQADPWQPTNLQHNTRERAHCTSAGRGRRADPAAKGRLPYANLVQRRRSGRAGAPIRGALRVNREKAFGAGLREFLTGDRRFSWLTASQGAGHGCCMYRAPPTKDMLSEMKTSK